MKRTNQMKQLQEKIQKEKEEEQIQATRLLPAINDPKWKIVKNKRYKYYTGAQFDKEEKRYRVLRITASVMAIAAGLSTKYGDSEQLIRQMLGLEKKYVSPEAIVRMTRGTKKEPMIRKEYEKATGNTVEEIGLAIPDWNDRIGASVDGLIVAGEGIGGSIEIKCPGTGDIYPSLNKMLKDGRENFDDFYHDHIQIEYYVQMQAGMAITVRPFCDFVVYGYKSGRLYVERVWYNKNFWENEVYPRLLLFLDRLDNYVDEND